MSKKPDTVDAYIATLDDGVQQIFAALRETVLRLAPGATETIKYDMAAWQLNGTYLVYAGAWKKHIGLYPVGRGDGAFEAMLAPYRDKKDTVKFVYAKPMPFDVIEAILRARLAEIERHA
ncbi:MAG: DUF1801 domain-containing protein [Candidatus Devosia phytovorans]|uniref:DUF1801 domain-containing protein n=1 Tax=Candidatus Devosia phytovorans TaxID=3121372 RepID=A0AAJ6B159_9HYPH|nr:DUF1801 domain-containing protein [Devosia sp.]WEK04974.1 MAG: DUF1801 domain-containing protein [Devosia sp.]